MTALEGVAFLGEAATVRIEYEGAHCSDSRPLTPRSLSACRSIHEHHRCGSSAAAPPSIREHSILASGYRIDFPLIGSLQNWKLFVGAADPTEPNGHVVPLDSKVETNNKHRAKMVAKLTSRFVVQAHRPPFFLIAAASVLVALQLQNGYAQNASAQLTLDKETHAVRNSTPDATASPIQAKAGQIANVKTYGAVGDGVTNDTDAFNAALESLANAGGGRCLVPKGTYIISASGITSRVNSGVHLVGEGHASILKIAAMPTGPLIRGDGNDWSIENLALDMGDYVPSTNRPAISCRGDNWRVANCAILKIGRVGISVIGGSNWSIERNHINKTTPAQILNESILVTKYGDTRATNARIIDNVCEGSGILFWGFKSTIARNHITGAGFGAGIFTGRLMNCHTMQIRDNVCSGGRGFDENRTWVSGFELWAPDSVIANNTAYDNDGTGIIVGGQNCIVIANHCYNNGVHSGHYGFGARYAGPVNNASGSVFIGNLADDTHYPGSGATQAYGYAEQPGGLHDIVHIGNDYSRNRIRPAQYHSAAGQPNVSADQGSRVIQTRLSPEMKNRLKALAQDADLPDSPRRALHEYLGR
jgi:parallel beta-helix repeat protein